MMQVIVAVTQYVPEPGDTQVTTVAIDFSFFVSSPDALTPIPDIFAANIQDGIAQVSQPVRMQERDHK